jgi:hypothetical protein
MSTDWYASSACMQSCKQGHAGHLTVPPELTLKPPTPLQKLRIPNKKASNTHGSAPPLLPVSSSRYRRPSRSTAWACADIAPPPPAEATASRPPPSFPLRGSDLARGAAESCRQKELMGRLPSSRAGRRCSGSCRPRWRRWRCACSSSTTTSPAAFILV